MDSEVSPDGEIMGILNFTRAAARTSPQSNFTFVKSKNFTDKKRANIQDFLSCVFALSVYIRNLQQKNGGVKPSFFAFVVLRLFFRNRFNRAFASASAAVNAYVGIDCIYVAVLSDCFYGAGGRASAASQAEFFIDYVCHI